MACHNCGRTFLPDRLAIHLKSCDKDASKKKKTEEVSSSSFPTNGSSGNAFGTPSTNGKSLKAGGDTDKCTLCGRQFGANIMEQHIKSC